ncbi:TetR/AcrR family transcriptional regulator [Streptobacillus felis]|uniref:TetR/AcrR family transcriptional regulator n=1 Tax=Streptobacillus felis TaxID=1384509 RepID=A0A7Z0PEX1_9FUSO|nr:TetR/AcrR family transcriptional regulator [Streptobacillus felis]NYV27779.1 TetR/AcrR family transcriptional regulator [Streptobacillus felis]
MEKKKTLQEKKNNVIIKSADLFFKKGYVNTGIQDILDVCNIPKGSFYYYFKSKDELLLHVIEYHRDNILELFEKNVDDLSIYKLKSFFSIFLNNIAIIEIEDEENDEIKVNEGNDFLFGNSLSHINKKKFYGGSPLGNLNSELSNLSDEINAKIVDAYFQIESRIYFFLETLSIVHNKYKSSFIDYYTYLLINNLEGTCLKLKRMRNQEPIEEFLKFFDILIDKMIND